MILWLPVRELDASLNSWTHTRCVGNAQVMTYLDKNDKDSKESHGSASKLTTADMFTIVAGSTPSLYLLSPVQRLRTLGTPTPSDVESRTTRSPSLGAINTFEAPTSRESSVAREPLISPPPPIAPLLATIQPRRVQQPAAVRNATMDELCEGPARALIDKHDGTMFWSTRASMDLIIPRIRSIKEYCAIPSNRYLCDEDGLRYAKVGEHAIYMAIQKEIGSTKGADTQLKHFNDYERGMKLLPDSPTLKKIFRGDIIRFPLESWRTDGGTKGGVPVNDYRKLLELHEAGQSDPVKPVTNLVKPPTNV